MVDNTFVVVPSFNEETNNKSTEQTRDEFENHVVYCSICHINFIDQNEYLRHEKNTHAKKKYPCFYCTSCFRRQDHLKRHINSLHSTNIKTQNCPVCSKEFQKRDDLHKHVKKKHSNEKSFNCRECSVICTSMVDLETHENSHLLIEKHLCTYCKKPFKRRDHMLRHIKTIHLKQRLKCPVCYQDFNRRDHVTRHCREKHDLDLKDEKMIITDINTVSE